MWNSYHSVGVNVNVKGENDVKNSYCLRRISDRLQGVPK